VVGGPLTIDILPPSNGTLNVGDYEDAYLATNGAMPGLGVATPRLRAQPVRDNDRRRGEGTCFRGHDA